MMIIHFGAGFGNSPDFQDKGKKHFDHFMVAFFKDFIYLSFLSQQSYSQNATYDIWYALG